MKIDRNQTCRICGMPRHAHWGGPQAPVAGRCSGFQPMSETVANLRTMTAQEEHDGIRTVGELRLALSKFEDHLPVEVWVGGTYITLSSAFISTSPTSDPGAEGKVLVEGNVRKGGF